MSITVGQREGACEREKDEAKAPCGGRVGDSELREREERWARREIPTFLPDGKGVREGRWDGGVM